MERKGNNVYKYVISSKHFRSFYLMSIDISIFIKLRDLFVILLIHKTRLL